MEIASRQEKIAELARRARSLEDRAIATAEDYSPASTDHALAAATYARLRLEAARVLHYRAMVGDLSS